MDSDLDRTEAASFKIEELLDRVRSGSVRIPRFQRPLRWTASDVERLFDSIYRGYPIGTLLFWERAAEEEEVSIGPITMLAPVQSKALWVVDGQQRLTSLAAALLATNTSERDPRFDLVFDLYNERFVKSRPTGNPDSHLPLRDAYDLKQVLNWLRERQLPALLQDRAFNLADRLRNFEVPAYIVKASNENALRQIFDRTNTFGKRMTRAEVFQALHASTHEEPEDLRALADDISALGFGTVDDNTLLFCVLSVRGPDVLRDFHGEFDENEDAGETFALARSSIERAVEFLRDYAAVPHISLVPYQFLTVGLVRFFSLHPRPNEWNKNLLRRWFWRSAVHGPIARRGATGTLRATTGAITSSSEYESVRALLELASTSKRVPEIGAFRWTNADVRVIVSAMTNLSPVDLVSGRSISVTELVDLHGRNGLVEIAGGEPGELLAKSLANRMFIDSDRLEEGHFTSDAAQSEIARADDRRLATHAMSPRSRALLGEGDVTAFLRERALTLSSIVDEFVGARAEWAKHTHPSIDDLRLANDLH